jgi:two-component system, OmpR family, sensor kinase
MNVRGPLLRSLKNKLALLFLMITALAFAVVIFVFLPQLQSQLEGKRIDDLKTEARTSVPQLQSLIDKETPAPQLNVIVRAIADNANSRVTLLGVQKSGVAATPQFYVISDSNAETGVSPPLGLASRALAAGPGHMVSQRRGSVGEVAQPLFYQQSPDWIAVYERKFDDVEGTVSLVRTRLLEASAAALLVALIGGYLVARALARRVGRLEHAAKDLAEGRPGRPLPVDSGDELGRLTHEFNEMRAKLDRVDRARREFIANASHELRTPIFSLGGFVELLQDEELDEATREEFLATMKDQVERLQKLAVDLLDLSRLDAGSMQLNREQVDLSELAQGIAQEFRPVTVQHGTRLELELADESVDAVCDRERVAQIMRILLDNALRHTPPGTNVTVIAERNNGAAQFAVSDAGPGLDEAAAGQVFERFYTADAARGSGMGLAIAQELAEAMEGKIELRSRPGQTVFTLALPGPARTRPTQPA